MLLCGDRKPSVGRPELRGVPPGLVTRGMSGAGGKNFIASGSSCGLGGRKSKGVPGSGSFREDAYYQWFTSVFDIQGIKLSLLVVAGAPGRVGVLFKAESQGI